MTYVLRLKQFSRMLVNVFPGFIDLFFHYDIQRGSYLKHFLQTTFKVVSSAQIVSVHDDFLLRFEGWCNLM